MSLAAPPRRASLGAWLREGARTMVLRHPRWERVHATPLMVALLLSLTIAFAIGIGRLYVDGAAVFLWRSVFTGWAGQLLIVWACYAVRPGPSSRPGSAPGPAHLLCLMLAQGLCLSAVVGAITLAIYRSDFQWEERPVAAWAMWLAPFGCSLAIQLATMLRAADRKAWRKLQGALALVLAYGCSLYIAPHPGYWNAPADTEARQEPIRFTQDIVEDQGPLLDEKVGELKPQRPGIADMYTITFAPYEGQEVFRRESRMVSEVMAKRFDAAGRGLQLLNHRDNLEDMPWATPTNLQRAIESMAATMDKEEDVLFIHLTSHGAKNGELAANFWPLDVDPVTPTELRKWLDEAGIRHRVISISACFAGNWIAPLANDDTLVMTASDATHTSYGCGHKSPLTFFGRAMYDEQLRNSTLSFEEAHAAARNIIAQREKEAGKDDGYSNPQIKVGSRIRPYLEQMRARLAPR